MIFEKIAQMISEKFDIELETITMESNIREDFDADSLDLVDMITDIEDEYELRIPTEKLNDFVTVGDIVSYLEDNVK